jgi:hypothetical protein
MKSGPEIIEKFLGYKIKIEQHPMSACSGKVKIGYCMNGISEIVFSLDTNKATPRIWLAQTVVEFSAKLLPFDPIYLPNMGERHFPPFVVRDDLRSTLVTLWNIRGFIPNSVYLKSSVLSDPILFRICAS